MFAGCKADTTFSHTSAMGAIVIYHQFRVDEQLRAVVGKEPKPVPRRNADPELAVIVDGEPLEAKDCSVTSISCGFSFDFERRKVGPNRVIPRCTHKETKQKAISQYQRSTRIVVYLFLSVKGALPN
jgi:hypothetical protein